MFDLVSSGQVTSRSPNSPDVKKLMFALVSDSTKLPKPELSISLNLEVRGGIGAHHAGSP